MESLVSQADEKWSMILKYIEQSNGEGDGGRWTAFFASQVDEKWSMIPG